MKMAKDLMLMMLGGAAVIAYQKYNKDIMDVASDMFSKASCTCTELENMQ